MKIEKVDVDIKGFFSIRDKDESNQKITERGLYVKIFTMGSEIKRLGINVYRPVLIRPYMGRLGYIYHHNSIDVIPYSFNAHLFDLSGENEIEVDAEAIKAFDDAQTKPETCGDIILSFVFWDEHSRLQDWVFMKEEDRDYMFDWNKKMTDKNDIENIKNLNKPH